MRTKRWGAIIDPLDQARRWLRCSVVPFSRKLKAPIALDGGRRLATLADARALMMGLPELHLQNAHWQAAGAMLLRAAKDKAVSMDQLQAQLSIALRAEGLIMRRRQ